MKILIAAVIFIAGCGGGENSDLVVVVPPPLVQNCNSSNELSSLFNSNEIINLTANQTYFLNSPIYARPGINFIVNGNNATIIQCGSFDGPTIIFKESNLIEIYDLNGILNITDEFLSRWLAYDRPEKTQVDRPFIKFENVNTVIVDNVSIKDFIKGITVIDPISYIITNITFDGIMDNLDDLVGLQSYPELLDYIIFNKFSELSYKNTINPMATVGYYDWKSFRYTDRLQGEITLQDKLCTPYGKNYGDYLATRCQLGGNYNAAILIEGGIIKDESIPRVVSNVITSNSGSAVLLGQRHNLFNISNITCNTVWDNCVYVSSGHDGTITNVYGDNLQGSIVKINGTHHNVSQVTGGNALHAISGHLHDFAGVGIYDLPSEISNVNVDNIRGSIIQLVDNASWDTNRIINLSGTFTTHRSNNSLVTNQDVDIFYSCSLNVYGLDDSLTKLCY